MKKLKLKKLDDEQKAAARKISGLAVSAFSLFTLIGIISYLFHWREDMSGGPSVSNAAGSLGAQWGHFLVGDCFGLGSLAFLVILVAVAVRLLTNRWRISIVRTTVLTITGALIAAIAFTFTGRLFSLDTLFGGGLGGRCGEVVVVWAEGLVGRIVTGVLIAMFIVVWACACSPAIRAWIMTPRKKKEDSEEPVQEEESPLEAQESEVIESEVETSMEDLISAEEEVAVAEEPAPAQETVTAPAAPAAPAASQAASEGEATLTVVEGEGISTEVQKELPRMDNRMDPPEGLPKFKFPPLELLAEYDKSRMEVSPVELTKNKNKICATLANYRIQISEVKAVVGPTVTLYKVYPAPGVKISSIKMLQEDIAMSLGAMGVRVVTLADCVGIEVANEKPSIVPLRGLLNDDEFRKTKAELPVALGYTITQKVKVFDLADAPHLLVAGATKQGKSVCLNVIISSLLYSKHPSELKLVFIDPKMVEFSAYSSLIKHYLAVLPDAGDEEEERERAIVKNAKDAERILKSLCVEMDDRYLLLSKAGVNKVTLYNDRYKDHKLNPEKGHRFMPYIVAIVDEYADLTMSVGASPDAKASARSISTSIIRLAQKGRAAGIHVILATQRPSVDVINGLIKSNFPMRIAFRTSSRTDSMTIIDAPGAEKLIGKGDMLFSAGIDNERIQCGYIDGREIDAINSFIGEQTGFGKCYNTPYYLPEPPAEEGSASGGGAGGDIGNLDERFEEAARLVVTSQKASTSSLQTRLGMGFAKAARVMDQLETAGIVGPQNGAKPREVLIPDLDTLEETIKIYKG